MVEQQTVPERMKASGGAVSPETAAPVAVGAREPSREQLSMKTLLEAGVHFGHQTWRRNPRMKPYIFTQRNGIHIVDLSQTLALLEQTAKQVAQMVANGGSLLFVGTKKQAQEAIQLEAQRCGMSYVSQRWLGGTLTNWATLRNRIERLKQLDQQEASGFIGRLPKREGLRTTRLF